MTSQTWQQVDNFIPPKCICHPPHGNPDCPKHGYKATERLAKFTSTEFQTIGERHPGEKFASELMGRVVSDLGDYRRLKFLVMRLIAETMHRVPSTMLGWTPNRLKEIIDLCK